MEKIRLRAQIRGMIPTIGIAASSSSSPLAPWRFERRPLGPNDVQINITCCGVCHSDLHTVRAEWGKVQYPLVPGHEIVGQVVAVGKQTVKWKVGDTVGVGCMVDSCRTCSACREGLEQYCAEGNTGTYDSIEKETGKPTQGGYSQTIVVNEDFVLRIPKTLDAFGAAPLLCAGVTTWSPLRHWEAGPGKHIGVVGIGGLGHMAIKLGAALGAEVTAFTSTAAKASDARRLGAHNVVVGHNSSEWRQYRESLNFIIDTVSAPHDLESLMRLLKLDGTLCLVGASPETHQMPRPFTFIGKRRAIAGSLIGGIRETQEMLDFCGERNITADIERIDALYVNEAWDRMLKSDVRYRFVIDTSTIV